MAQFPSRQGLRARKPRCGLWFRDVGISWKERLSSLFLYTSSYTNRDSGGDGSVSLQDLLDSFHHSFIPKKNHFARNVAYYAFEYKRHTREAMNDWIWYLLCLQSSFSLLLRRDLSFIHSDRKMTCFEKHDRYFVFVILVFLLLSTLMYFAILMADWARDQKNVVSCEIFANAARSSLFPSLLFRWAVSVMLCVSCTRNTSPIILKVPWLKILTWTLFGLRHKYLIHRLNEITVQSTETNVRMTRKRNRAFCHKL